MSKQNVMNFLEKIGADNAFSQQFLSLPATVESWVKAAAKAGFDFSGDELRSLVEQRIGRPLTLANCVEAISEKLSELDASALDAVAGGTGRTSTTTSATSTNLGSNLTETSNTIGVYDGSDRMFKMWEQGPAWSNDPKLPSGGTYNSNPAP